MKISFFSIITLALVSQVFYSQKPSDPANVTPVEIQKNAVSEITGNLNRGQHIEDLSWAWNSSVACFPATQKEKFTGKHVLYSTTIPTYSEMEVTVVPDDPKANFSIYAYQTGVGSDRIVPELSSCIRCEVDHKWDRPRKGKTQDHTRTAKNLVAIGSPYQVIVGVVGAAGLADGGYTLKFDLKSRK